MSRPFAKLFNRLSLQTVLTIPFVIQAIGVVGVVGYLSFKNGEEAVNNLASQLRSELTARILQQLQTTVEIPYVINQINANSIIQGDIDVATGKGEHQLWQQAKVFPSTSVIYCATEEDGAFLGVRRSLEGDRTTLEIQVASQATNREYRTYDVDLTGRRSFLRSKNSPNYDPRLRPWYRVTKSKGRATWSKVYLDFDTLLPTITANTPIYNGNDGQLLGVCATDIILSKELNDFLRGLEIGQSGIAFVVEPSGLLIASSTQEAIASSRGENTKLLAASESRDPLIRGATRHLSKVYSSLERVESSQLDFFLDGKRQYLEVVRFDDGHGLDWIIVLVVPEDDFMEQIHRNTRITILLCILALLVTIFMGLLLARWLTQPLLQLSATAKEIAKGEWDRVIELDRCDVIGDFSRSFSAMARQLQESFTSLEEQVKERTIELIQLNQELERLAHSDGLTQVANRRYFEVYLQQEWQRLAREKKPLSLILCDVDYFKRYNDTYGHQAGDRCLQQVARVLSQIVQRPADLVARYGGEEFAIILSNTNANGATHVTGKIMATLQQMQIPHDASDKKQVTLSMGIATTMPSAKETPHSLITAADRALYAAKSQGRDCYSVATERREQGIA